MFTVNIFTHHKNSKNGLKRYRISEYILFLNNDINEYCTSIDTIKWSFTTLFITQTLSILPRNILSGLKNIPNKKIKKSFFFFFFFFAYIRKKCSVLKIENNSSRINFTHFREKKAPSRT